MKKIVCLIVIFSALSVVSTSCGSKNPIYSTIESKETITQELSTSATSSQSDPSLATLQINETGFTAVEFGLDNVSSYFYWSPSEDLVVFIGSIKDGSNKFTSNVYILKLADRKITKILDGVYDKTYYMPEPKWSDDENMLTIPFYDLDDRDFPIYIYDIKQSKLEKLPVKGMTPSICPDKTKIAYANPNTTISIYNMVDKTIIDMPVDIKGLNPIWFSDNNRILFFKYAGKNPSGLEGAELMNICVVDTRNPQDIKLNAKESVYNECKWITQDETVWINSGLDDGHQVCFFDVDAFKLTDLGEAIDNSLQINNKEVSFVVYKNSTQYELFSRNMKSLGIFTIENGKMAGGHNPVLCVYKNERLLYLDQNATENKSNIMISLLNGQKYMKIYSYDGLYTPLPSVSGSKIALMDSNGSRFIVIDTFKIVEK